MTIMTITRYRTSIWAGLLCLIVLSPASANLYWTSAPASANTGANYYIEATAEFRSDWDDRVSVDLYRGTSWIAGEVGGGWAVAGATFNDATAQIVTYRAESYDASGVYRSMQHSITIISPNSAPEAAFDWASDVANGGTLSGGGWAADPEDGAPVSRVEVYVDGAYRGNATLGGDRPDVSNHFGRSDFRYSGFNFSYGISGFSIGGHTVMVRAFDQKGAYSERSRAFNVNNTGPSATISANTTSVYVNGSVTFTVTGADIDGNLTGINLDYVSPGYGHFKIDSGPYSFDGTTPNNGGMSFSNTGSRTQSCSLTFTKPGTYQFKGAVADALLGWYGAGYSTPITITVPNRDPSVVIQILDASRNVIALNGDGRAHLPKNAEFYIRVAGSDPDGRLGRLYSRLNKPSGSAAAHEQRDVSGGSASWDFGPYNTGTDFGLWDVWGHAEDLDQTGYQWNGGGWAGSNDPNVLVYSPPQNLTLSGVPAAINLGQSINISSNAIDEGGNMNMHSFWRRGPRESNAFSDWNDWIRDYDNRTGWSNQPNPGTPSHGGNSTISATFTPNTPGWWQLHANASDADGYWGPGATSAGVEVKNVYPTNALSVATSVPVGTEVELTQTASNPTSLSNYEIGFRILERREDASGAVIPGYDWTEIHRVEKSTGNKTYTTKRPAPTTPGKILYQIYSWNQWMSDVDNLKQIVVTVPNSPPKNISMSPSLASIGYGQSVTISARSTDVDGDLKALHLLISGPGAAKNGTWAGNNPSGQPWNHFVSITALNGGDSTVSSNIVNNNTGVTLPLPVGNYSFTLNSQDSKPNYTYSASTVMATLTVTKSTPAVTFSNKAIVEGTKLTSTHLNATVANPHNAAVAVPGSITYTITAGGVAPYPNGSLLQAETEQVLPNGTYTVQASIPASANYNAATKDVTFTVSPNLDADNDGDGVSNGVELELGTNPNAASESDPAPLNVQIHTPPSN